MKMRSKKQEQRHKWKKSCHWFIWHGFAIRKEYSDEKHKENRNDSFEKDMANQKTS